MSAPDVTAEHLEILRHMLGLTDPTRHDPVPYRDHYAANPGDPVLATMAECGLVRLAYRSSPIAGGLDIYVTTDVGRAAAIASARQRRKSKGARRYLLWLDISDVVPDLTFKDFLTRPEWAKERRNA